MEKLQVSKSFTVSSPEEGYFLDQSGEHVIFRYIDGKVTPISVTLDEYLEHIEEDLGIHVSSSDRGLMDEIERELIAIEEAAKIYNSPTMAANMEAVLKQRIKLLQPYHQQALAVESQQAGVTPEELTQLRQEQFDNTKHRLMKLRERPDRGWEVRNKFWVNSVFESNPNIEEYSNEWYAVHALGALLDRSISIVRSGKKASLMDVLTQEMAESEWHLGRGNKYVAKNGLNKDSNWSKERFNAAFLGLLMEHNQQSEYWESAAGMFDKQFGKMARDFGKSVEGMENLYPPRTGAPAATVQGRVLESLPEKFSPREAQAVLEKGYMEADSSTVTKKSAVRHLMARLWESLSDSEKLAADVGNPETGLDQEYRNGIEYGLKVGYSMEIAQIALQRFVETVSSDKELPLGERLDAIKMAINALGMMDARLAVAQSTGRKPPSVNAVVNRRSSTNVSWSTAFSNPNDPNGIYRYIQSNVGFLDLREEITPEFLKEEPEPSTVEPKTSRAEGGAETAGEAPVLEEEVTVPDVPAKSSETPSAGVSGSSSEPSATTSNTGGKSEPEPGASESVESSPEVEPVEGKTAKPVKPTSKVKALYEQMRGGYMYPHFQSAGSAESRPVPEDGFAVEMRRRKPYGGGSTLEDFAQELQAAQNLAKDIPNAFIQVSPGPQPEVSVMLHYGDKVEAAKAAKKNLTTSVTDMSNNSTVSVEGVLGPMQPKDYGFTAVDSDKYGRMYRQPSTGYVMLRPDAENAPRSWKVFDGFSNEIASFTMKETSSPSEARVVLEETLARANSVIKKDYRAKSEEQGTFEFTSKPEGEPTEQERRLYPLQLGADMMRTTKAERSLDAINKYIMDNKLEDMVSDGRFPDSKAFGDFNVFLQPRGALKVMRKNEDGKWEHVPFKTPEDLIEKISESIGKKSTEKSVNVIRNLIL